MLRWEKYVIVSCYVGSLVWRGGLPDCTQLDGALSGSPYPFSALEKLIKSCGWLSGCIICMSCNGANRNGRMQPQSENEKGAGMSAGLGWKPAAVMGVFGWAIWVLTCSGLCCCIYGCHAMGAVDVAVRTWSEATSA
jgi:hypothetical protein